MLNDRIPFARTARHTSINPVAVVAMLLVTLLAGCGVETDDVETVDDAVTLLQDLERNGVWETIRDGFELLNDQDGYTAMLHLDSAPAAASGDALPANLVLTLAVDADGDTRYTVQDTAQDDDSTTQYVQFHTPDDAPAIYREDDGAYTCADGAVPALLVGDVPDILAAYGMDAVSARTLAVVDDDGTGSIAERETTHYRIVSKHADALAILEHTDNDSLRTQVEQADGFTFNGTLDLDDTTAALLHVEMQFTPADSNQQQMIRFDVTQWGDVPDITQPDASNLPDCN